MTAMRGRMVKDSETMNGSNRFPAGLPWPSLMSYAALLPEPLLSAPKDFFIYTVPFGIGGLGVQLAISAVNQTAAVQVQDDSAFLIVAGARAYLTSANAAIAGDQALALISVVDSGSGRQLVGAGGQTGGSQTYIENWFGTGKNPAFWPYPKIVKPNSTLTVSLTNLEATARNYEIAFIGFKIFRTGAMDPYAFASQFA
jgi:hypothetical protein